MLGVCHGVEELFEPCKPADVFRGRAARERADALLADFDLSDAAARQVKDYSGGMRRRLDIAASLVVTPGVLFLDEPTTGLDPSARQKVWRLIRKLAGSGVTVLLTTQYLEEADQLARRIAVVDHGRKRIYGHGITINTCEPLVVDRSSAVRMPPQGRRFSPSWASSCFAKCARAGAM